MPRLRPRTIGVGTRARACAPVVVAAVLVSVAACGSPSRGPGPDARLPDATAPVTTAPDPTAPVPTAPAVTAPVTVAPPVEQPPPTQSGQPVWETLLVDHFDGPAGTPPVQWHTMTGWSPAALDGAGRLEVGDLAQIRSTSGWVLPAGTQVRVSASLVMPDTSSNYAALWIQHPTPLDPREIDVIESYGPRKAGGAQLGSHLCYDETLQDTNDECGEAGLGSELWPVGRDFVRGAKPWDSFWEYHAEFTVGGDRVRFQAQDGAGHQAYDVSLTPDPRRVPGNAQPFHLRLSNKDVDAEHALPGGSRRSMVVDWVTVQVMYPSAPS